MKSIIMPIMAAGLLLLPSCTKKQEASPNGKISYPRSIHTTADGEDENRPIITEKATDVVGTAIPGASVTFINGKDTLSGVTDASGQCVIYLTQLGTWALTVTHAGYIPVNTSVTVADSVSQRTDIMLQ